MWINGHLGHFSHPGKKAQKQKMTWLTVAIWFLEPFHLLCRGWRRSRSSPTTMTAAIVFQSRNWLVCLEPRSLAQSCLATTSAINLQNDTSYLFQNQQRRVWKYVCMQPVDHLPALRLRLLLYSRLLSNLDWGKYTLPLLPPFPCQPAVKYSEICSYLVSKTVNFRVQIRRRRMEAQLKLLRLFKRFMLSFFPKTTSRFPLSLHMFSFTMDASDEAIDLK